MKRLIVGNSCERGLVEDVNAMREIKKGMDAAKDANPNMAEVAAHSAFRAVSPGNISDPAPDVFAAVQQYLGLKLEEKKAPLDVLVVDYADKTPTEN